MKKNGIQYRGMTSFFTLFGFLVMSITGLILYIVPEGRIAYWTFWDLIGLSKTDWGSIHILSSILFIVAGAFHIYFNWKPLMHYLMNKVTKGVRLKRELVISTVVSVFVVISALYQIPPLSYLLNFNEFIKEQWVVTEEHEPPFGHAEDVSLIGFSRKMDIDLEAALAELRSNGIQVDDSTMTLEEISIQNGIAPMELYSFIKKFEPKLDSAEAASMSPEDIEAKLAGTGLGNRSLSTFCESSGMNVETALSRLSANGIEADQDETLKKIAEKAGVNSIDIAKVILIEPQ